MTEQKVQLRYLHNTPRKMRLVGNAIKGMPVNRAEAHLLMIRRRAAQPLIKLLRSAIAAAKQNNLKADALYVKSVFVDKGPHVKRFLPRARGMATPIHKTMSHITIVLAEGAVHNDEFVVIRPKKKLAAAPTQTKRVAPRKGETEQAQGQKPTREPGMMRRIFRRKSV